MPSGGIERIHAQSGGMSVAPARLDRGGGSAWVRFMGDAPDIHELAKQVAVLEKRMKTMHAEYEGALDRLRADMERRDADSAKRDKDNLRWQIGLWIAAVVILGVLIRL